MPHLKLFCLGAPRIEVEHNVVDSSRRKVMAILVYLAVTRQQHSRDTLATLLWPDSSQVEARASLRRYFYTLTNSVGDVWFEAGRETIGLAAQPQIWVDVEAFRQHLAAWRNHDHPAGTLCDDCLKQLTAAVALYQGDFLAGFTLPDAPAFDEWQFFQAESLRHDLASALKALVQWHSQQGDYAPAIEYARRRLALDPLHEPAHRALMRLYALAGQASAAVRQYQECVRLLEQELGVTAEAKTTALFEAIRTRRFPAARGEPATATREPGSGDQETRDQQPAAPPPPAARHNLPPQLTPFVGRTHELTEIARSLQDPACRLLTLVGPGGMGKTRLAMAAAQMMVDLEAGAAGSEGAGPGDPQPQPGGHWGAARFGGGVYFVPLVTVHSPGELVAAIAAAVGLHFAGNAPPQEQLLDHLREKQMLLVLDNFEQILDADEEEESRSLLADLLAAAPGLKLLVTSREALNLHEEWFYQIGGLAFPEEQGASGGAVAGYDAVRFFEQCARRADASFSLALEEAHVVRICQLVEGMPLALELAAAWLKVLPAKEIVAEIRGNLDILTARHRNASERHRSIRAIFEQTWQRLAKEEQLVLSKLSVFQGGCTRDAAARVAGGTIAVLGNLVDKALLRRQDQPLEPEERQSRFHFHPLLQQYAAEKLQAAPEVLAQTEAAHAHYYLNLVEVHSKQLKRAERKSALSILETELANLRAAWQWATRRKETATLARFALPFSSVFDRRPAEGVALFQQAAAILDETNPAHHAALGAVLVAQAEQTISLGHDPAQCIALAERALALLQHEEAPHEKLKALDLLGNAFWLQGDYQRAKTTLEAGLAFLRANGMTQEAGDVLIRLGLVERELSGAQEVIAFYEKSLDELRALDDPASLAHQLLIYGEYLVVNNQPQEGRRLLEESLALAGAAGGVSFFPFILLHLGYTAYKLGDYAGAEGYLQEVLAIAQAEARTHPEALAHIFLGRVNVARRALAAAEHHLCTGLRLGWSHKLTLTATLALVCFAEFYAAQGDHERAITLLTLALQHPATEKRDRQDAEQQRQALQRKMSPDAFAQAVAQGTTASLAEVVEQILLACPHPTRQ